jgi:hypothetical protein
MLSPAVVQSPSFGQRFSTTLSGQIYAQPLVYQGTVFVATESDIVSAIDGNSGAIKWQRQVGTPEPGLTVAPGCTDLAPTHGITSTPVIDPSTGVLYVSARNWDGVNAASSTYQLHAMNVNTGAELGGWPITFAGVAANDPTVTFNPVAQMQRPGLLLLGGSVYVGFGSNCDVSPYKGWVIGVSTTTQRQSLWTAVTGAGIDGGGVWHSGGGFASDGPGQILLATGNGPFPSPGSGLATPPPGTLGQAAVRLTIQSDGSMVTKDWFSPVTADGNNDIGSGGPVALPDSFSLPGHPHLMLIGGKTGMLFLLDRDNLGGRGSGADTSLAELSAGQLFGHFGVWPGDGGYVYADLVSAQLQVYRIGLDSGGKPAFIQAGNSQDYYYYGSGSPVVTSNGTASGSAVLWIIRKGTAPSPSYLVAYNPVPDATRTLQIIWKGDIGNATKFSVPAADGNHIYVATADGKLIAFGSAAPTVSSVSPSSGTSNGGTQVVLSGSAFTGTTGVRFGATPATNFTVSSDSQITATSPAGNGIVDVTVTTPGGTSATSPSDQFTYVVLGAPGAPTNVTATGGPGSATVSWTAPPNGGSAITQYTITPYVGPTAQPMTSITGSPPPTTATVSQLANGTTYTFTVSATNAMGTGPPSAGSNAVTPNCPCTIWTSGTPANPADSDGNSVEVGVKFRADANGLISGVRFYKGLTNTGTHVGNLWSATGTLLASATFAGETASGWQQVNFVPPVPIVANTTYIASYFAPAGHYASSPAYFTAAGVDASPLHALRSGTDGPNAVYVYSLSSAFPTHSFNDANYWVDVVYSTAYVAAATGSDNGLYVLPTGPAPAYGARGGFLIAAPAIVAIPQNSGPSIPLYLGTGTDHDLYVRTDTAGWQRLTDSPFYCIDNPAGVVINGTLYVACQGADNALWHAEAPSPTGTTLPTVSRNAWQSLGGVLGAGPAVVSIGGTPTYVVVTSGQAVLTRTLTSGYATISGWRCIGHPAAAAFGTTAYFACHGSDGALWYSTNTGGAWSAAQSLGGGLIDGPGIAATPAGPFFFVEGTDGALYQRTITAGWTSDGGQVKFGAAAAGLNY